MQVHVLLEQIDLGDQIIGMYADYMQAQKECDELNAEYRAKYPTHQGDHFVVDTHPVIVRLHRWCGPTEN